MTAPVSLAAIKARKASLVSGLIGMTEAERDALVELACEAMTRRPIADTPAPQPPATDPHDGWFVLLKDGCAMPKNGATVDVTVGNEENDRWVERCSYLPSARGAPGLHGFDLDLYEGEFLVAWRAAPKPFRGGV